MSRAKSGSIHVGHEDSTQNATGSRNKNDSISGKQFILTFILSYRCNRMGEKEGSTTKARQALARLRNCCQKHLAGVRSCHLHKGYGSGHSYKYTGIGKVYCCTVVMKTVSMHGFIPWAVIFGVKGAPTDVVNGCESILGKSSLTSALRLSGNIGDNVHERGADFTPRRECFAITLRLIHSRDDDRQD